MLKPLIGNSFSPPEHHIASLKPRGFPRYQGKRRNRVQYRSKVDQQTEDIDSRTNGMNQSKWPHCTCDELGLPTL